jgi:hypothetical protein
VALHGSPVPRTVAVRYRDRRADVEVRPGVRQVLDGRLAEVPV